MTWLLANIDLLLLLVVAVAYWLETIRERREAHEADCVERARRGLGHMTWERME